MMTEPLTFHIMTASLTPGDAIGNYILLQAEILRRWGAKVYLYADHVAPEYGALASRSIYYRPNGSSILWYHYSIDSENIAIARKSDDFLIVDYHGITPPHLFGDQNHHLKMLCQRAIDQLPDFLRHVDAAVVHSQFTEQELLANHLPPEKLFRFPLAIETNRFGSADEDVAKWAQKLDYLLFIGRIVPQKDILALVHLWAAIQKYHPDLVLILVGSYHLTPAYKREIDQLIAKYRLTHRVLFTGQINRPSVLAALLRHARFYCALSEWESFCVPVAESLYFGTPAIVHNVPPLPEVAGVGGIVIDKHHPSEAAPLIAHLLTHPDQYAEWRKTTERFGRIYTDHALSHAMRQFLANLLEKKQGK